MQTPIKRNFHEKKRGNCLRASHLKKVKVTTSPHLHILAIAERDGVEGPISVCLQTEVRPSDWQAAREKAGRVVPKQTHVERR